MAATNGDLEKVSTQREPEAVGVERVGDRSGSDRLSDDQGVHKGLGDVEKDATGSDSADGQVQETKMTLRRFMSFVGMAFLWTASQIPAYLFGGIPPLIYGDIGGVDNWVWFVMGYLLGLAAICPFVGALSDLFGRRWLAIGGMAVLIVGQIVASTAHTMNIFIAGMTISGVGAGINELTALAGTAELVPTRKRGIAISFLIATILPFVPSVMWAQLISANSSWRYVGLLTSIWSFIGLVVLVCFYFPPPRPNSAGLSRRQVIAQIDFLGGFLSISSIVLFDAGILWGGYQYAWTSAHTLVPLILGGVLFVAFVAWEVWGAPYPMLPHRLGRAPKNMALLFLLTFISGANFVSIILLWPTQAFNVYGHDPVQIGLRGLPFGLAVMVGCVIACYLLSVLRGGNKWLLLAASALMTAGCGAMAAARRDNMPAVYGILVVAGLGVGGIIVPASLIMTIIAPPDLIATITALTLAIRVVGGSIGYAIYYNVLVNKLVPLFSAYIPAACVRAGITNRQVIGEIVELTAASLTGEILHLPGVDGNVTKYESIVLAGQLAYAGAYPWVYYCSIAFGGIAVIASFFLDDVGQFMDEHVAVVLH